MISNYSNVQTNWLKLTNTLYLIISNHVPKQCLVSRDVKYALIPWYLTFPKQLTNSGKATYKQSTLSYLNLNNTGSLRISTFQTNLPSYQHIWESQSSLQEAQLLLLNQCQLVLQLKFPFATKFSSSDSMVSCPRKYNLMD